jgi:Ca2+-binding RTX toxin-like protein
MSKRRAIQTFVVGLALLIFVSIATAFAANLEVTPSNLGQSNHGVSANQLKPPECSQNLTHIVRGAGVINGTTANDLIIGSSGNDTIQADDGDDCILGGDGDDTIYGGNGTDVCFGGSGTDIFYECETEFP